MRIISWNVNGIRSNVFCKGSYKKNSIVEKIDKDTNLGEIIDELSPDIICFQETKCDSNTYNNIKIEQYYQYWNESKKEGARSGSRYSGTSIWTKAKPKNVYYNFDIDDFNDEEGRIIICEYENFLLINTYCPNTGTNFEYRVNIWDKIMYRFLRKQKKNKHIIWTGDLNVSINNNDVFFSDKKSNRYSEEKMKGVGNNAIAGFTKEERENFKKILDNDFVDAFRHIHGMIKNCFTWWNLRIKTDRQNNLGMRLDYFVVSKEIVDKIKNCIHLTYNGLLTNPTGSDHCPILLDVELGF